MRCKHGRVTEGYEESTYEEFYVSGQYRNNAFEMHNKEDFLAQNGKHENILVSG